MVILIGISIVVVITIAIVIYYRQTLKQSANEDVETHLLDVQFSESNLPSKVYKLMFIKGTPWIGGYELGIGKTYVIEEKKK